MKKLTPLFLALLIVSVSCVTTPETIAYRTTGSIVTIVEAARQAFVEYENTGAVTQSQHDRAKAAYEDYQRVMATAEDLERQFKLNPSTDPSALNRALSQAGTAGEAVIRLIESFLSPQKSLEVQLKTGVK